MAKNNEESSNLNVLNKPPLKKTKTLPSLNLRVSVTPPNDNNNGIGGTSSSTAKTDFSEQQWNYPSFLGIGSTSRKRRQTLPPPPKPPVNLIPPPPRSGDHHDSNKTTSSLLPPPSSSSITKQQQHSISSPIFYLVSDYFYTFHPLFILHFQSFEFFLFFLQFLISCIILLPYSAYLQYKLAKLKVLLLAPFRFLVCVGLDPLFIYQFNFFGSRI